MKEQTKKILEGGDVRGLVTDKVEEVKGVIQSFSMMDPVHEVGLFEFLRSEGYTVIEMEEAVVITRGSSKEDLESYIKDKHPHEDITGALEQY